MATGTVDRMAVRAAGGLLASLALSGCAQATTEVTPPLVILLVDTSSSLERKSSCVCQTPSCSECVPDCALGERSQWVEWVEALTGTYHEYACESLIRTAENGATFDLGASLPHIAPLVDEQADDGLLDIYGDRLRFGLATFDSWDTYVGAPPLVPADEFDFEESAGVNGLWSYNPERDLDIMAEWGAGWRVGEIRYPATEVPYYMDTGIRGPQADEGALIGSNDADDMGRVNMRIQESLRVVRPYGGAPIAAALVDLHYWLSATYGDADDGARPYVVLLTESWPDDDYRSYGCNCAIDGDPSDPTFYCDGPENDPSEMHCPYPTADEAAHLLRCGSGEKCTDGVAARVYVLGYEAEFPFGSIDDVLANLGERFLSRGHTPLQAELNRVAAAGGSLGARMAKDPAALRSELGAIFDEIESSEMASVRE